MKKFFYYSLLIASMLAIVSCSKDDATKEEEKVDPAVTFPAGTDYFQSGVDFDNKAGEKTISFTSNVPWTASVDETRDGSTWCTVTPTSGEAGQVNIKISVKENTTYDDRNAVIRVTYGSLYRNIVVNQKQVDALTLTTDRFEVPVSGGDIAIEVKSNIEYQVKISDDCKSWIHENKSQGTRAYVTSNVNLTIDPSTEYEKREGHVEIISGDKKEVVSIYQVGEGILTLTKDTFNISSTEQDIAIEVNSNFEYSVEFPGVDWVSENVGSKTRAVSTHTINLHVKENQSYDNRTTSLRIYDKNSDLSKEIIIVQSQQNALQLEQKEYSFDENGGTFTVNINSNVEYKVKIGDSWITEETSPSTRALVASCHTFKVKEMTDNNDRESKIIFSDSESGITDEIVIKQKRSLFIESESITLILDDSKKLSCTNRTGQDLVWSSSNPDVVKVDNNGNVKGLLRGTSTITVSSVDGKYSYSCLVTVQNISDCIFMERTGSGMIFSGMVRYTAKFTIMNYSPVTIHIVSLAGVTNGVEQDLLSGESVSIELSSSSPYIQSYEQTLIYTYNGKQYSLKR